MTESSEEIINGLENALWQDKEAIKSVELVQATITHIKALEAENAELRAIINTPENDDFIAGIAREAEHQRRRWNDEGKTDWDWFWLIGYLSQKAATDKKKRKHHIITTCAALMNWHKTTSAKEQS